MLRPLAELRPALERGRARSGGQNATTRAASAIARARPLAIAAVFLDLQLPAHPTRGCRLSRPPNAQPDRPHGLAVAVFSVAVPVFVVPVSVVAGPWVVIGILVGVVAVGRNTDGLVALEP